MKYRITCQTPVNGTMVNYVLLDYDREGCELLKAVLTRSFTGPLSDASLSFTITTNHPNYDSIFMSLSTISVFDDDVEVFRGRPINCQIDKVKSKTFTCEGQMKFLIDVPDIFSVIDEDGNVVIQDAITAAMAGYNQYAAPDRQIYLAPFTIPGKARTTKGASVYSNISAWLKEAGYYGRIEWDATANSGNGWYTLVIDSDTGDERNDFTVEFGTNVRDYLETVNLTKLYTAIYPVGKTGNDGADILLNSASGVTVVDPYKIDTTKKIIYNEDVVAQYGEVILYKEIDLKDETQDGQTLYTKGVQELKNASGANDAFTINAVDPRLVGIDDAVPMEGCYYPVQIPLLPGDAPKQRLTKIVTDMTKPSGGSLTFGGQRNLLTDQAAAATVSAGRAGAAATDAKQTAVKNKSADSVTETGTTDGWTWRKWKSGARECWKKAQVTIPASSFTQINSSLYYKELSTSFPTDFFTATPDFVITPEASTYSFWYGVGTTAPSKTTATFRIFRHTNPTTQFTINVNIHAYLTGGIT